METRKKEKERLWEARNSDVSNVYFIGVKLPGMTARQQERTSKWVSAKLFNESGAATGVRTCSRYVPVGKEWKKKGAVKDLGRGS